MGTVDDALDYAAQELHVHPFHNLDADGACTCGKPCESPGKHPWSAHGKGDATTDPATIRALWKGKPAAQVGVNCGASGVVVLDVDVHGDTDGRETWAALVAEYGSALDAAPTSETPNDGFHVFYSMNGARIGCPGPTSTHPDGPLGAGVDVKGEGGSVILPSAASPGRDWVPGRELDAVPMAPLPPAVVKRLAYSRKPPAAGKADKPGKVRAPGRDDYLTSRAGSMRRDGFNEEAMAAALQVVNEQECDPPKSARKVAAIAASVSRYKPSAVHDCSDDGNAQRIIGKHGDKLRYLPGEEKWLIWDERRWKRDDVHEIEHLAAEALRTIHHEAGDATGEALRKKLGAWAIASGQAQRRSGALLCARSEPAVVVRSEDLDSDPYLLNVMNGTLDLHTAELRPHRQEDALTWLAPVEFHGLEVRDDVFERVLHDATGGDPEFQRWLQRYAGMSLVGEMTELVLILLGGTETGKSTLTSALTATLGEGNYALTGNQEALLKSSNIGGPRGSVMAFEGRRLVTIPEFDPKKTLDEPLLKTLTGERTFQGRELYRNDHAMKPISKLWLHTNHMPRVSVDDASLWRRLRVAPFVCRPAKIDETIKPYLNDPEQAGPAVLAWALQGCLDWQAAGGGKDGLGPCAIVDGATAALRIRMDPLADFFEECCVFELDAFTPSAEIGTRYGRWADDNNVPKNQRKSNKIRATGLRLRGASDEGPDGYRFANGKQVRGWTNVRLDGLASLLRSES